MQVPERSAVDRRNFFFFFPLPGISSILGCSDPEARQVISLSRVSVADRATACPEPGGPHRSILPILALLLAIILEGFGIGAVATYDGLDHPSQI